VDFLIEVDFVSEKDLAMVGTLLDLKDVNQYMGRACLIPWDDDVQEVG
jgi:hypothetical protein